MKSAYDVLKSVLRTEKGTHILPLNKYLFHVAIDANKIQIKQAIEDAYNVKVIKVNTAVMRGKIKRLRYKAGKTPDWKKAIITLKEGDKIDIATT
ncbi:MAG: 50S ribosomal protein L23 [Candidatus Omnitrophica bacterium]|nr:50S ribosomal protein L23 [Candidatus Omnitrophota bacterium]MBU4149240.1 50S ribosomal protein L23 [Candidatus Omnitrophota bacterium]